MNAIIRVNDGRRSMELEAAQLPIEVNLSSDGTVRFESVDGGRAVAWIASRDGQIFIQPEEADVPVCVNKSPLKASIWLLANDELQVGDVWFKVERETKMLAIVPVAPTKIKLVPPTEPPSARASGEPEAATDESQNESTVPQAAPQPGHPQSQSSDASSPEPDSDDHTHDGKSDAHLLIASAQPAAKQQPARFPEAKRRTPVRYLVGAVFIILLICSLLLVITVPLELNITPTPDQITVEGTLLPAVRYDNRMFVLPGHYRVTATKKGYHDLNDDIEVEIRSTPSINRQMVKLPGAITIATKPVDGAELLLNGKPVGTTPVTLELEAGEYELRATAERYLPAVQMVEVEGMAAKQAVDLTLEPGWGTVTITSEPQGAQVSLDGTPVGTTPLKIEPMAGKHQADFHKNGWKAAARTFSIEPKQELTMPVVVLEQPDVTIELTSTPGGSGVVLNGQYQGVTPLTLTLPPGQEHQLSVSKQGHVKRSLSIQGEPGETKRLNVHLEPEYGFVFITSLPADAKLTIDGKPMGEATARLRLSVSSHKIEVSKDGYQSFSTTLTPSAAASKKLDIVLKTDREIAKEAVPESFKTTVGQVLRKVSFDKPVEIQVGSSRREPGRRSNESLYKVRLTRDFYISEHEVTNDQFQQFRQSHDSKSFEGIALNERDQPVVHVAWDDAAAYCNWLSQKQGLPPAYEQKDGRYVAVEPMTTGYRLPTEVEWVYVACYQGNPATNNMPLRFIWGNDAKPPEKSGNFADNSAVTYLPMVLQGYTDGYRAAAPVGSFPANPIGVHDLGGNVSEWCHDLYAVEPTRDQADVPDPTGPAKGEFHVIRGASWRDGNLTELRLSYRDYANNSRDDLGFRIARYAE